MEHDDDYNIEDVPRKGIERSNIWHQNKVIEREYLASEEA